MSKIKLWFRRLLCPHTVTKQVIKTGHNVRGDVQVCTVCIRCGKVVRTDFYKLLS